MIAIFHGEMAKWYTNIWAANTVAIWILELRWLELMCRTQCAWNNFWYFWTLWPCAWHKPPNGASRVDRWPLSSTHMSLRLQKKIMQHFSDCGVLFGFTAAKDVSTTTDAEADCWLGSHHWLNFGNHDAENEPTNGARCVLTSIAMLPSFNKRWEHRLVSTRALTLFQKLHTQSQHHLKKLNFAIASAKFDWCRCTLTLHYGFSQLCAHSAPERSQTNMAGSSYHSHSVSPRVRVKIVNQVNSHITTRSRVKKIVYISNAFSLTPFCRTRLLALRCVVKWFVFGSAVLHSWLSFALTWEHPAKEKKTMFPSLSSEEPMLQSLTASRPPNGIFRI